MAGNRVELTLSGDSADLEKAFDRVGDAAKDMESKVEDSSRSFDRAADATDTLDTRAMGFRDTITGVQDSVSGFSRVLKGDFSGDALFTAGAGVGDLASGFTNLLIPALQKTWGWLAKTRAGILLQAAASGIAKAATAAWSVVQTVFNVIMALNPVVLIIAAILILIGVIVLIATKTQWFQNIWEAIWSVIGDPVKAVWNWIKNTLWPGIKAVWEGILDGVKVLWQGIKTYFGFWKGLLDTVIGWVTGVWTRTRDNFNKIVDFVKGLPRKIRSAASGMFDGIKNAFKSALNWIIGKWNGLSFSLPSVTILGQTFGGATLSTPNIPYFHKGGIVPGAPGSETLAMLQAGERVTPAGQASGPMVVSVQAGGGGTSTDQAVVGLVLHLVRTGALQLRVSQGRVSV